MLALVSDYLYYSLDAWGKQNPDSIVPQCDSVSSCLGEDFYSQKCCGAISIARANSD